MKCTKLHVFGDSSSADGTMTPYQIPLAAGYDLAVFRKNLTEDMAIIDESLNCHLTSSLGYGKWLQASNGGVWPHHLRKMITDTNEHDFEVVNYAHCRSTTYMLPTQIDEYIKASKYSSCDNNIFSLIFLVDQVRCVTPTLSYSEGVAGRIAQGVEKIITNLNQTGEKGMFAIFNVPDLSDFPSYHNVLNILCHHARQDIAEITPVGSGVLNFFCDYTPTIFVDSINYSLNNVLPHFAARISENFDIAIRGTIEKLSSEYDYPFIFVDIKAFFKEVLNNPAKYDLKENIAKDYYCSYDLIDDPRACDQVPFYDPYHPSDYFGQLIANFGCHVTENASKMHGFDSNVDYNCIAGSDITTQIDGFIQDFTISIMKIS